MTNSAAVLTSLAREITEQEQARRACDVKSLMHACHIGQLLLEVKDAQRIPELLAGEYDDEAWLGAMLADLEARPAGTQA